MRNLGHIFFWYKLNVYEISLTHVLRNSVLFLVIVSMGEPIASAAVSSRRLNADELVVEGKIEYHDGRYDRALAHFKQALMFEPQHREAVYYAGLAERALARRQQGVSLPSESGNGSIHNRVPIDCERGDAFQRGSIGSTPVEKPSAGIVRREQEIPGTQGSREASAEIPQREQSTPYRQATRSGALRGERGERRASASHSEVSKPVELSGVRGNLKIRTQTEANKQSIADRTVVEGLLREQTIDKSIKEFGDRSGQTGGSRDDVEARDQRQTPQFTASSVRQPAAHAIATGQGPAGKSREAIMEQELNRIQKQTSYLSSDQVYGARETVQDQRNTLHAQEGIVTPSAAPQSTLQTAAGITTKPEVPHRVGDIRLFSNGVEASLDRPILLQDGRPLAPLRDVAAALFISILDLGRGMFRLFLPDGTVRDIRVSLVNQEPVLSEEQLRDAFSVQTFYDEQRKTLYLETTVSGMPLQTYTIAKPPEQIREEQRLAGLAEQAAAPPQAPQEVPEAARPDIDLHGTVSYGHREPHDASPDRNLVVSLAGRAYDFDVRSESNRKDRIGTFREDYTYLNFNRPHDLYIGLFDQSTNLYPLRSQSEIFTGAKVRKEWDRVNATTFSGGIVDDTVFGPGGSVKYLGRLYEAREELNPVDWLRLKGALLYAENEADIPSQSGLTRFPRQNLESFGDAVVKLPLDAEISGQVARANYKPDDAPDLSIGDWDWRVASALRKPSYDLGYAYEFVGEDYASIGNPAVYQDYKGWNLFGNYRLTNALSMSGNVMRYRNNVDEEPGQSTQENQGIFLSSTYRFPWDHSVALSFNDFLSNPSGPNSGSSSRSNVYRIDYGLPFFIHSRLQLNYQYLQDTQPAGSDSLRHSAGGTLFKGFTDGSSIYLSQQVTDSAFEQTDDSFGSTTSLNINYQLNRDISLYANSAYTRVAVKEAKGSDVASGSTGFRYQLAPNTALTSEYRVDSFDINRERGRWPGNWSVFFLVSQSFDFVSQPTFGIIDGWVVKDADANGRVDPTDTGIEDIVIRLDDGRQALTDPNGRFKFIRVVPGQHTITVDAGNVPGRWMLLTPEQRISVGRKQRLQLSFPLVEAAAIQGRVFIDDNGDGMFQDHEEPLENIAVILMPGEQFRRTNEEGVFRFDPLPPGLYTVQVHTEDLPVGYGLASDQPIEAAVAAGEDLTGIRFPARLKAAAQRFQTSLLDEGSFKSGSAAAN